ncbi:unnamed protein product [Cuscuta epithymum]|uniref:Uncharacterized protein n=1 Tax=Cuscuta epithymum TaxID=186058 RepID=A0AAV0DQC6_9ASTE|nr:unnamed protein product [Cuscuta epithymum]
MKLLLIKMILWSFCIKKNFFTIRFLHCSRRFGCRRDVLYSCVYLFFSFVQYQLFICVKTCVLGNPFVIGHHHSSSSSSRFIEFFPEEGYFIILFPETGRDGAMYSSKGAMAPPNF